MQKWEYTVWYLDTSVGVSSIEDELERRGREGWELVVTPVVWDFDPSSSGRQLVGILKRPVGAKPALEPGSHVARRVPYEARDRQATLALPAAAPLSERSLDDREGPRAQKPR